MYHFVGIKGAGMSSLAQIMKELGYNVQGSDVDKHFFTEQGLIEKGIEFSQTPNKKQMDTTKATFCNARAKSRPQVCVDGFISSQEESERARFTPPNL